MKSTRPLILAVVSFVIIILFFSFDIYKNWFHDRVYAPMQGFGEQLTYMEPQERLIGRLGNSYYISYNIGEWLRSSHKDSNALILLPPNDYMKEKKVDYPVPEPAVFYYYTGLKSVTVNNKGAEKANFAIVYQDGANLQVVEINDANRAQIFNLFRQYKN